MAIAVSRQPLVNRVSWGALFAGFFFGMAMWFLLLSLGAGIGFAAFNPADMQSWRGLGIGFGIWGVIAGIVSMFLAAWLSSRLSAADSRISGMLHGAALWGLVLVGGVWLATMAVGRVVSGAANVAGEAVSAAGGAAGQAQGSGVTDPLVAGATAQLNDWLRQQGMSQVSQQQLRAAMNDVVANATSRIRQGQSPAEALDRQSITASLAEHTNLSPAESDRAAEQVQTQLSGQLQSAQQQLAQGGETAADATATGAWAFFLYGVLTLAAAMLGGRVGVPKDRLLVGREERVPPPGATLPQRA
jgi:hypothetical protein